MKTLYTFSIVFISLSLLILKQTNAIPRRGIEPWSLILCKFADLPKHEPRSKKWFEQWLTGSDSDSIQSFFNQISNGVYSINGSTVHGWYTLDYTQKKVLSMTNLNPQDQQSKNSFEYFDKIKELCVQRALQDNAILQNQKITVINAGTTAVYEKKHGVLITPQLMFSSVLTHEMIHSFFIGHSYSDQKIKVFPYALAGEYDDRYDLMSTANAYMHRSKYGLNGPGLNGAHLDFLGWLPMDRILYFGRDGRQNYTLRLSSLSTPYYKSNGWLLVMIPFDRDDPNNFYTIELRTARNFDKGIIQTSVLIHRVQKIGESYYSVLLSQARDFYELTEKTEWVKFLESNTPGQFQLIRVTVQKIYENDADVTVLSTFNPNKCLLGEIFLPIIGLKKSFINSTLSTTTFPTTNINEKESKIIQTDEVTHVCLEKMRDIAQADILRQSLRQNFFALQTTFGANVCRNGYVWRALDAYDYVCVTPHRRDVTAKELSQQDKRVSLNGLGCVEPYLARRAFPGDEVCVLPAEKSKTLRENIRSTHILQHFAFFNGVDTVGP